MNPDWSLLPPELLQIISEKIISISEFVRFRAVCNTWRSASSSRPQHLPPQLPWVVLPCGQDEEGNYGSMLSVYNLSQSRTHILDLPEIKDKQICGCSNGWLILEDQDVWLLNPITRDQIRLPSLHAAPNLFVNLSEKNSKDYFLEPATKFYIKKAILSSNPGTDPDCFVMAIFAGSWELMFCRIGDECWTVVSDYRDEFEPGEYVTDIGYHNGLFYAINYNGHVQICDLRSTSYKVINPEQTFNYIYPVGGCYDEKGLMILCSYSSIPAYRYSPDDTCYIMTWSDKKEYWLDMEEEKLNSNIFFLEFGRPFNCISYPFGIMKLEELEGNCMCYISTQIDDDDWYTFSIKLVGLSNGREKNLASNVPLFNSETYQYICTATRFFWLTPTLC